MAIVIPDSISSKASQGEKILYGVLRDNLPDDCLVWYNSKVSELHPDFMVLSPTLGLLIINVKEWYLAQINHADHNHFEICERSEEKRIERQLSPLHESRSYFSTVLNTLKQYSILTNPDGNYRGRLSFPVGYGAVMQNINVAQAQAENIYHLLPQPQVAYRDELVEWTEFSNHALINRLKEMFTVRFPFPALTDDQLQTIRGILHPETIIDVVPATQKSVPAGVELQSNSSVIRTLDPIQEQVVRGIRDGHRLIIGEAGSGKTLILIARAKYLIQTNPEQQILVLCFSSDHAAYLRSLLRNDCTGNYRAIEILTFQDWAKNILGKLPNLHRFREDDNEHLGEELLGAIRSLPEDNRWDSIFVDEGQNFSPSWFKCCTTALKDPENGNLMIVVDNSRILYECGLTWGSVGVKVRGRTKTLTSYHRKPDALPKENTEEKGTHQSTSSLSEKKMDWQTLLHSLQADFIQRLRLGYLLHSEQEGTHSELTVIGGKRLSQLRDFCWEMAEKYKRNSRVRDVFINNMKGKLGEEVVKARLGNLVTEVDYEKRLGGDGKIDFTLTSNPNVGIQVKARHGDVNTVRWSISREEVEKNAVLVCVLIQEEVSEAQTEYHLVLAGFLPTEVISFNDERASFRIDELLYGGGICNYLSSRINNLKLESQKEDRELKGFQW